MSDTVTSLLIFVVITILQALYMAPKKEWKKEGRSWSLEVLFSNRRRNIKQLARCDESHEGNGQMRAEVRGMPCERDLKRKQTERRGGRPVCLCVQACPGREGSTCQGPEAGTEGPVW